MVSKCDICLMDSTASDFQKFSNKGCNFCLDFKLVLDRNKKLKFNKSKLNFDKLIKEISSYGKNKQYDCIVGVSGGLDSSYTLYKVKKAGLRPLAVHMDNGWNSELAQNNIAKLVKKLDVDIYTHVIEWDEYKRAMEAFFKANVIDIELLYDNAMLAVNYNLASKFGIKYILSGTNTITEGMRLPKNWSWFKNDKTNIKSICKKFENLKIKTIPTFGTFNFIYYELIKKIKWIATPDYFDYTKEKALKILMDDFDFKPYPYKHYESIFTRFYQGYLLPKKFGIDKRKLHLSTLLITNQINLEYAVNILKKNPYPNIQYLEKDLRYFLKKMKWDQKRLTTYLNQPEVKHDEYLSEKKLWEVLASLYKLKNLIFKKA